MSINPPDPEVPSGSDPSENPDTPSPYSPEGQQFAASPAATPPPIPAAPVDKPAGGSLWGGVGLGCGGYIALLLIVFALASGGLSSEGILSSLAGGPLFYIFFLGIPLIVATALSIPSRTRRIGIGVFIAAAAAWLIVLGPCIAIVNGL